MPQNPWTLSTSASSLAVGCQLTSQTRRNKNIGTAAEDVKQEEIRHLHDWLLLQSYMYHTCSKKTALHVAQSFIDNWIVHYGMLISFLSDSTLQFMSKFSYSLCRSLEVTDLTKQRITSKQRATWETKLYNSRPYASIGEKTPMISRFSLPVAHLSI